LSIYSHFIHIDCDLYSSTKFILNTVKEYINPGCVIVFDELVNYPGFDGDTGELKAFYEFITENNVKYEWNTHGYAWILSRKCRTYYSFYKLIFSSILLSYLHLKTRDIYIPYKCLL